MAQQLLVWRDRQSRPSNRSQALAADSQRPACRVQALWTLGIARRAQARADRQRSGRSARRRPPPGDPTGRGPSCRRPPQLGERILALADDADLPVQLQRAYTLGEWHDPRSGQRAGRDWRCSSPTTASWSPPCSARSTPITCTTSITAVLATERCTGAARRNAGTARRPGHAFERRCDTGRRAGKDRPRRRRQVRGLAIDGPGRICSTRWPAQARPGKSTTPRKTWPRCSASPARPWPTTRPEDEDACGRCGCWAATRRARSATSPCSSRCWCRNRAALCKRPPSKPWRASTATQVPAALLAGWKSHGPALRSQILDVLSEPRGLDRDAADGRRAQASARRRYRRCPPAAVVAIDEQEDQAVAARLLAGSIDSNRQQVVEAHSAGADDAGRRRGRRGRVRQTLLGLSSAARRRPRSRAEPGLAHRLFAARRC